VLTVHSVADGAVQKRIPIQGLVATVGDEGLLVTHERATLAFDWEGRHLWSRTGLLWLAVSAPHRYLITEETGRVLTCLSASSGELLWQFRVPPVEGQRDAQRWAEIPPGFPSVAVAEDRVLVYPMSGRVYILSLADGEVLSEFQPPASGLRQTTEDSIFFMSTKGLVQFDHREMRVVTQIDYSQDVAPLYRGQGSTVTGYALTTESIVWAASHGALMGVGRESGPDGKRRTWLEEIPGGIMPLAMAPTVYGDDLYFVDMRDPSAVHCYRSVDPS
jgi:hypothetical protein